MKLKLDENGHVVVVDGKPVYVDDAGKDYPMDVPQMYGKIITLTTEAKNNRTDKEELQTKLAAFDGIESAEEAKKALGIVKALDEKKLVDAGKIEEIKAAAVKAHEEQSAAAAKAHATELKKVTDELGTLKNQYHSEKVNSLFAGSKFIKERIAVPADLFQAKFGQSIKVEDGQVVAYKPDGNKVYSKVKPGEIADFEEAIEILVDDYADKDNILKGSGHSGGGSDHNNNGGGGGHHKQEKDADFGGSKEQRAAAIRNKFPELAKTG